MFDKKAYMVGYNAQYRREHRVEIAEYQKQWQLAHKAEYPQHRVKKDAARKKWKANHPEYGKQYYQKNPLYKVWTGMK